MLELRRVLPWYGLAILVVVADQCSKAAVMGAFRLGESLELAGFFNLVFVLNSGASFSFLASAGGWQRWLFSLLALAAVGVISFLLRQESGGRLYRTGLALIMGGALGNVVDRLTLGAVVDFLDFHWGGAHFPAFNVADSAISLGVACFVLEYLLDFLHGRKNQT